MNINQLVELVSRASNGKNDISNGAVGYNGYGFVFLDTMNTNIPYCKLNGGHILARIGFQDNNLEFLFPYSNGFSQKELMYVLPRKIGLMIGGYLKTLLPTLEFGGFEYWFNVWMLVKTFDDDIFPAVVSYHKLGPAIDVWNPEDLDYSQGLPVIDTIHKDLLAVINFWGHDFDQYNIDKLEEALLGALTSIAISDYNGVYRGEYGNRLMGIIEGRPFVYSLGDEYTNEEIQEALDFCRIVAQGQDNVEFGQLFEPSIKDNGSIPQTQTECDIESEDLLDEFDDDDDEVFDISKIKL